MTRSSRFTALLCIATFSLLVDAVIAHESTPASTWSPAKKTVTAIPGIARTFTVQLIATRTLPRPVTVVARGLAASVVSISPAEVGPLLAGSSVTITVKVDLPIDEPLGSELHGVLLLKPATCAKGAPASASEYCTDDDSNIGPALPLTVEAAPFANTTLYSEIGDPRGIAFDLPTTDNATLLGTKSADGTVVEQTGVLLQRPNQPQSYVKQDALGRPTHVVLGDVCTLDITYLDAVNFTVSVTYANGQKVIIPMKLPEAAPANGAKSSVAARRVLAASGGFTAPTDGTLDVSVTDTLGPVSGATVIADIVLNDPLGASGFHLPLDEASPGHYTGRFASIANPVLPPGWVSDCSSWAENAEAICSAIGNSINYWATNGCGQLAALGPPLAAQLCEAAFLGLKSACGATAYTKYNGGEFMCTVIEKVWDFYSPSGLKFTATASSANRTGMNTTTAAAGTTFVPLPIVLPPPDCTTYTPDTGSFPITWTMTDNWTYPLSNTSAQATYTQSMPDPVVYLGDLGLNIASGFQSCNGAFKPAHSQWIQQPTSTNVFTYTWTASLDASGTLTITEAGISNTVPLGFYVGDTVTSYSAMENATWTFNIPTGVYNITQTDSQSITFIDSSGNTVIGSETGSGGTSGTVPVIPASTPP